MAHICPNCFEPAPLLFRYCPECDFDMIECEKMGCNHSWDTREQMIYTKSKERCKQDD